VRSVTALGDAFGWGARRVHREISATCGYGPKTLQRIVRMQRVLRRAHAAARQPAFVPTLATRDGSALVAPLAQLAFDCGYADQAHMTRDFRDLTGFTPRALLRRTSADVGRWLDESR